jgi:hypothetical protein
MTRLLSMIAILNLLTASYCFAASGVETGTSTSIDQATACQNAINLARTVAGGDKRDITEVHCTCQEVAPVNKYDRGSWSCIGFASWRDNK